MSSEEKEALIAHLDAARLRLTSILTRIDTHTDIYPHWQKKQFLDHVAGWDDAVLVALRSHIRSEPPVVLAPYGIDYYNAQTVTTREALPLERTLSEFEVTRDLIRQTLREMPDEKFQAELVVPWGPTASVTKMIEVFAHHENEHAAEIESLLAQKEKSA